MNFIYNCIVNIVAFFLLIISLFSRKIKLFVSGRKETYSKLSILKKEKKLIWFHVASLGEFEQGRPIIEKIKKQHTQYKILLTFFSPSGYEICKNYTFADVVCYLPLDSKKNVDSFFELVKPNLAIFIKYEFWPNFLNGLKKRQITTILVSGIFRKNQIFFKNYGGWMRGHLSAFSHFFVQNKDSKILIESIGLNNITISGDTRFDRVYQVLRQDNYLDFISEFKNDKYTIVAGSTWKEDEKLLVNYINNYASDDEKFIIAPHNINKKDILELQKSIDKKTILFSEKDGVNLSKYNVFIINTVGILAKIYSSADVVYVGGGFTKSGVHNVLEPATFGIPIVIGTEYKKYKEVVDLVFLSGCKVISNEKEFSTIFTKLKSEREFREKLGAVNQKYVRESVGATDKIMNYMNKQIF